MSTDIASLRDQLRAAEQAVKESFRIRGEISSRLRQAEEDAAFAKARQLSVGESVYPEGVSEGLPWTVVYVDPASKTVVVKDEQTPRTFKFNPNSGRWECVLDVDRWGDPNLAYIK